MMMLARFGCAVLVACASLSTAAYAGPAQDRAEVRFGDLDLSTPAGVRTLNQRISGAATRVCVDLNGAGPQNLNAVRACKRLAMAKAQPSIQLAINNAQSGKQLAQNTIRLSDR